MFRFRWVTREIVRRCSSYVSPSFEFVEFRGRTQWSDIEAALENIGSRLSANHLGAAFAHTQKLLPRPPDHFLQSLSRRAIENKHVIDIKCAVILFEACAKLAFFDERLLNEVADIVIDQLYFVELTSIAKIFASLGHLMKTPGGASPSLTLHRVPLCILTVARCIVVYRTKEIKSLALLLYGMSELRYRDPVLLQLLADTYMELPSIARHDLTMTVQSLSRLNVTHSPLACRLLEEATHPRNLTAFTETELSNLIYSLCRMGLTHGANLEFLVNEAARPERLGRYTDHGLANIIYGVSSTTFGNAISHRFLQELKRNDRLCTCNVFDLTTFFRAMKLKPVNDGNLMNALTEEIVKPERFDRLSPGDIVTILVTVVDHPGMKRTQERIERLSPLIEKVQMRQALDRLSPYQLAEAVYALCRGKISLKEDTCSALRRRDRLEMIPLVSMIRLFSAMARSLESASLKAYCLEKALTIDRLRLYASEEILALAMAVGSMAPATVERIPSGRLTPGESETYRSMATEKLKRLLHQIKYAHDKHCLSSVIVDTLQTEPPPMIDQRELGFLLYTMGRFFRINDVERTEPKTEDGQTAWLNKTNKIRFMYEVLCAFDCHESLLRALDLTMIAHLETKLDDSPETSLPPAIIARLASQSTIHERERCVLRESGYVQRATALLTNAAISELESSDATLLARSMARMKLRDVQLLAALDDRAFMKSRSDESTHGSVYSELSEILQTCFECNIAVRVPSDVEERLIDWQRRTVRDGASDFSQSCTVDHLLPNLLQMKALESSLTKEAFDSGLDLIASARRIFSRDAFSSLDLQRSNQSRISADLKLYRLFLWMQQEHSYRPRQNSHGEYFREICPEYLRRQREHKTQKELRRVQEATDLIDSFLPKNKLEHDVVIVDHQVDILVAETKCAVLFATSAIDLDFNGKTETGAMAMKRRILEKAGYKVRVIGVAEYDDRRREEKLKKLRDALLP